MIAHIINYIFYGVLILLGINYFEKLINIIKDIKESNAELHKKINYIHKRFDIECND